MSYFETITDIAAFKARHTEEANSKDISNWKNIPPGDKWSTAELHAARLLVRKDTESNHMPPGLQNGFEKAKDARNSQEQIRDLVKGPRKFDQTMICTELVHTYGDYLGPIWAVLSYFGDDNTGDDGNGYATPALAGYEVPPEFATFKAASLFVERVAFACPPQHELRHFRPPYVVEFRDGPRPLAASTGAGARIRATVDSAMVSLGLDKDGWYERDSTQYAALVAARKRFGDVKGKDGLPVLTDSLLGQLTCEALALRLGLAQADGREGLDENVFYIVAARQYMRFLQFKISDAYIAQLVAEEGARDMTEFVELWATPWFDLKSETGRCNAVDNIVALIVRQSGNM